MAIPNTFSLIIWKIVGRCNVRRSCSVAIRVGHQSHRPTSRFVPVVRFVLYRLPGRLSKCVRSRRPNCRGRGQMWWLELAEYRFQTFLNDCKLVGALMNISNGHEDIEMQV